MSSPIVGLCLSCKNVKVIRNDRGSVFYLCRLAQIEEGFVKYPSLPVLNCRGYVEKSVETAAE